MVGVFGKSAHVGDADVKEMSGIHRAVGEPAAELRRLLDKVDTRLSVCAKDLQGEERTA